MWQSLGDFDLSILHTYPWYLQKVALNLLLTRLAKGMGANVTSTSLQRAAQSIVPLNKVMETIYKDCNKVKRSGHHGNTDPEETVSIIVKDLISGKVFETSPGRKGYPSFQKFKSNVLDIDYRDFFFSGQKTGFMTGKRFMKWQNTNSL